MLFSPLLIFSQGVIISAGYMILQPTANVIITSNGNWTNNATVTCNTNSWVRMTGNAIQNIQGTNTTTFSNLEIKTTSSVFVQRNITVNDNLQLTSGYFDLRGAITTLGSSSGNITGVESETKRIRATTNGGGTNDGFGVGTIRTTRINPTGNVANLGLNFTPGAALGSTLIIRGHERQAGSGSFSGNYSVFRYYELQPTTMSTLTVNNFYYWGGGGNPELNGHVEANLQMFQRINYGGPTYWEPRPSVPNAGADFVSSTTVNNAVGGAIRITLGSTTTPLPIELMSFYGECNNADIELHWQTASEYNNDYFLVEKSPDGENFSGFTQVPSQGNSNIIQDYNIMDYTPFNGTNYYRLHQFDMNGQNSYSDIISMNCTAIRFIEDILPISPSNGSVDVIVQGIPGKSYKIIFTNVLGQKIINKEMVLSDYQQTISIYNSALAMGIYYISLQTEIKNICKPIIISK